MKARKLRHFLSILSVIEYLLSLLMKGTPSLINLMIPDIGPPQVKERAWMRLEFAEPGFAKKD